MLKVRKEPQRLRRKELAAIDVCVRNDEEGTAARGIGVPRESLGERLQLTHSLTESHSIWFIHVHVATGQTSLVNIRALQPILASSLVSSDASLAFIMLHSMHSAIRR